jgi:hypothetical protein
VDFVAVEVARRRALRHEITKPEFGISLHHDRQA